MGDFLQEKSGAEFANVFESSLINLCVIIAKCPMMKSNAATEFDFNNMASP